MKACERICRAGIVATIAVCASVDSNVLGIPLEGYATSNNVPHSMIGPPRYKDAEFEMRESAADVHIKKLYLPDAPARDRGRSHSTSNVRG